MSSLCMSKKRWYLVRWAYAPNVSLTCEFHMCKIHMSVRHWAHTPVSNKIFWSKKCLFFFFGLLQVIFSPETLKNQGSNWVVIYAKNHGQEVLDVRPQYFSEIPSWSKCLYFKKKKKNIKIVIYLKIFLDQML